METDHYYLNKSMQKETTQNFKTGPAAALFPDLKAKGGEFAEEPKKRSRVFGSVLAAVVTITYICYSLLLEQCDFPTLG